jgi:hypothetical protein
MRNHRALFYLLIVSLGLFLGNDPFVGLTVVLGSILVAYGFYTLPHDSAQTKKIV